jgi:hypothetical protein
VDGLEVAEGGSVGFDLDSCVGERVVEGGNDVSSLRTDGASDGSEDGPDVIPVGLGVEVGPLVGGELGFKEGTADCEGFVVGKSDGGQESLSVSSSHSLDGAGLETDTSSALVMLIFGFSEGAPEESRRLGSRLGLKDGVEVGRNEGGSDALDNASSVLVMLVLGFSEGAPEESRRLGSRLGLQDGVEVEGVEVGRNEGASDTLDGTVGVSVVRG